MRWLRTSSDGMAERGVDMKWALIPVTWILLLLPSVALADPPDCARLLRQINHYESMVERAEDLGNELWADRTQGHVDLLEDRLASRCPNYTDRDERQEIARQTMRLMKVAADAAVTFFTMGAM